MTAIPHGFRGIGLAAVFILAGMWTAAAALAVPLKLSNGTLVDLSSQQLERLKAEPGVYFFEKLPGDPESGNLDQWVYIPIPGALGGGFVVAHPPVLDRALAAVGKPAAMDPRTDPNEIRGISGPWMWRLQAGYRRDELNWSIAGITPGSDLLPDLPAEFQNQFVNVLSELTWEDLQSLTLGFSLQRRLGSRFRISGSVDYGLVMDGDNQDSDYAGDDRTLEFSRSNNSADDGDLWDLSLGLGYDLALLQNRLTLSPLVGYSLHVQNLTMTQGSQTVSEFGFPNDLGPFPGLDSTYDANWYGPWVGLEAVYTTRGSRLELALGGEYHWADYEADATWNLRESFRQPNSFEHEADGTGVVLRGSLAYTLDARWSLILGAKYQDWETDSGIDRVFFSNGTVGTTPLNEVEWESYEISAGIRCRF